MVWGRGSPTELQLLKNWSSEMLSAPAQHLEECQAHLTRQSCPTCPCPGDPWHTEDARQRPLMSLRKAKGQFSKWKQKAHLLVSVHTVKIGDPHTFIYSHLSSPSSVKDSFCYFLKVCQISYVYNTVLITPMSWCSRTDCRQWKLDSFKRSKTKLYTFYKVNTFIEKI